MKEEDQQQVCTAAEALLSLCILEMREVGYFCSKQI